jgi:hypothetical protein
MTHNSIIPSRAAHDAHYAHCCVVCDEEFTHLHRPHAELQFMGIWGDACQSCHTYFKDDEADDEPA